MSMDPTRVHEVRYERGASRRALTFTVLPLVAAGVVPMSSW